MRRGGALQSDRDFLRKLIIGSLRRIADPEGLLFERTNM
jgi:hypothetical protein